MKTEPFESSVRRLRGALVGRGARIHTPFGSRLVCYADLTATGRLLEPVERFVDSITPYYANSHTLISSTGAAMTRLREQARVVVSRAVGAASDDVVIFVGAGATAAVNKLVGLLGLRLSDPLDREFGLSKHIPDAERPIVFVGPYEHHRNELPWVESVAEVSEVGLTEEGQIDLADLETKLRAHEDRPLKVGSFSACSNVTGILSDVRAIARTLHAHGALAFFDYAASGPYVPIDMHPSPEESADAIFLSPHKFVGGVQGSGLLVANRRCFRSRTPERPGGGTVDYVLAAARSGIDYTTNPHEREEGGTPAILGDIRAAAALLVKEDIGPDRILERETSTARRALARLAQHPRIRVLGPLDLPRLPIIALNIEGLHHDLVSVLLDHLFGIQNRAGCACAGPYGHRLLGLDAETSPRYREWVRRGVVGVKPGWVRVSLPYYADDDQIDFLLRALDFVADHGRAFVPLYRFSWRDGVWRHREWQGAPCDLPPLTAEGVWNAVTPPDAALGESEAALEQERYFEDALRVANALRARWAEEKPTWSPGTGIPELDELVSFEYVESDDLPTPGR